MITFYGEVPPAQYPVYQAYTFKSFQPSWYRGERYDYTDQSITSDRKERRHSLIFRNR